MEGKRGGCLITVYADVPAAIEDEYNRWYDTHHIPARLGVPGFLAASRYTAYLGEPKYLTLYELESTEVLKDPKLREMTEKPSDWDAKMMAKLQGTTPTIWKRITALGTPPERHASRVITVRIDPPAEVETEFNDWYETDHLPALAGVAGIHCARRYRARSDSGNRYLALYEFDDEEVPNSDAWKKAASSDWTKRIVPRLGSPKLTRSRRIFEARAS